MASICSMITSAFLHLAMLTQPVAPDSFTPLFDGRTLDGWVNVNDADTTWRAEDGMIKCTGEPICLLRTERMYENFVLELEWRYHDPKGNAGVFVWSDALPHGRALGQGD